MIWKYVMADLNFSGVVTFKITKYNALIRKIVNTMANGRIPTNKTAAPIPFVIPMVMMPAKLLRVASGGSTAPGFVIVGGISLAVFLIGWRAILRKRLTTPVPAPAQTVSWGP